MSAYRRRAPGKRIDTWKIDIDVENALLAVLMYLPDKLARQYAQDQMDLMRTGEPVNKKILKRIAKLINARSLTAQSTEVYRALPVIESAAE